MKISWRNNLLILWYRFFRSKPNINNLISIGKDGKGVSSILYLLPSEKQYAQIAAHFVKDSIEEKVSKIDYLIHEEGLRYYSEKIRLDAITFTDKYFNYIGVFKNIKLVDQIKSFGYDALVDLNQSEKQTISFLSLELDIVIKIGFKSNFSDNLYSIIIKPSSTGFLEKNYEIVEKILGLK